MRGPHLGACSCFVLTAGVRSLAMEPEIKLRLRWRQTWPDREQDFVAEAAGYQGSIGRIYEQLKAGTLDKHWFWSFQAYSGEVSRNIGATTGHESTAREAAREVERCWFAAIKGTVLENAVPDAAPVNRFAAAKGKA